MKLIKNWIFSISGIIIIGQNVSAAEKPIPIPGQKLVGGYQKYNYYIHEIDSKDNGRIDRISVCYTGANKAGFISDVVMQVDDLNNDGYADRLIILNLKKHKPSEWFKNTNSQPEYIVLDFVVDLEKKVILMDELTINGLFLFYALKIKNEV